MSWKRWVLATFGLGTWGAGLWISLESSYVAGGLLILVGGLCFVIAASGGWSQFVEGFTNWLFFWR